MLAIGFQQIMQVVIFVTLEDDLIPGMASNKQEGSENKAKNNRGSRRWIRGVSSA
jgi:hypothetical protein